MNTFENKKLTKEKLDELFPKIKNINVVVAGDFCVDIYWVADMKRSVLSRETPHYPLPVVRERTSPGAAGNVAANLKAIGIENVNVIGVIGNDWRGDCLKKEFEKRNIPTTGLLVDDERFTNAYCKPMKIGYTNSEMEDPRIDFENFNPISVNTENRVIDMLEKLAETADVLLVCDQFVNGCITENVRKKIVELAKCGTKVFVDSRSNVQNYSNVMLKPNDLECAVAVGENPILINDFDSKVNCAIRLSEKCNSKVCMTLGDAGAVVVDGENIVLAKPFEVEGPVDTVGAGDCFLSAFSSAVAAGEEYGIASLFANLAASIAVKQIGTTGVAEPAAFYNSICDRSDRI